MGHPRLGYLREYRKKNPDKCRAWDNTASKNKYYKMCKENPEKLLLKWAKVRAKRYGVEFDLTEEDVRIPKYCPILGIKLEKGHSSFNPSSPSLDRINPLGGYTSDNVQVISMQANAIKKNASLDDLILIGKWARKENDNVLKIMCPKHPRYTGERSPRASCAFCLSLHQLRLQAITNRLTIVGAKPTAKEAQEA